MKIYYLQKDQQILGPYTLDEVREQPLARDVMVWKDGTPDWVAAMQLEELACMFGLPVPAQAYYSSHSPGGFWTKVFSKWPAYQFPVFAR